MNLNNPEDFEKSVLEEIEPELKALSEMSVSERQFLNGIIRQHRPKKIVEIGVAAGGSSAVILNAIKDIEGAHLYSHDYFEAYYRDNTKKTGFVVERFPKLREKWTLLTGGMACNFLDEIGGDIDVCLLDTTHSNPGEFLDYLQILPYMKKNGIVVIHDTCLHEYMKMPSLTTCCVLLSAIKGEKIIPARTEHNFLPNIGAVVLDDDAQKRAFDVFNCLALPWSYKIYEDDTDKLHKHFEKHYNKELVDWFLKIVEYNKNLFSIDNPIPPQDIAPKPNSFYEKLKQTIHLIRGWK